MAFTLAAWGPFLRPSFDDVLHEAGVEIVAVPGDQTPADLVPDCDALYVRLPQYASADVIAALPNLRVIAVPGAGVEVVDLDAATELGIPVVSGIGMGAEAVADWTIASILWLVRTVGQLHVAMQTGNWQRRFETDSRRDLRALTIGIIGFGQIGRRVAATFKDSFGSRVVINDTFDAARSAAVDAGFELLELDELMRASDVVSLHAQAKHGEPPLLDRERLALLRETALVVNTSRGALLDYDALIEMLESGTLAGAALDVYPQEPPPQDFVDRLARHPNVLLSPHQAGMTVDATESLSVGVAASVVEILNGGRPRNCVNPGVWTETSTIAG